LSLTGIIFVIAFFVGCTFAFTRHPIYGSVTYIATFFLSPQLRWWGAGLPNLRWAFLAAAVTLLAISVGKKVKRPTIPITSHAMTWLFLGFVAWVALQTAWALAPAEHAELLSYYVKFVLSMVLIYYTVDSEKSLRMLMWSFVGGCFYFGWIAFTTYLGGRFEGFGGAGIGEANSGALTIAIGTLAASALFLSGNVKEKAVLFIAIPFILNGLVTTISRSGFLALAVGGVVFVFMVPKKYSKQVKVLSILALVLFGMLAGPGYWKRMQSMQHAGEEVQGVDTGQDRLELIKVQARIFFMHPMGCGATCTTVLSKNFLADKYLAESDGGIRERASHNTFMAMLVDHGVPGGIFYVGTLLWVARKVLILKKQFRNQTGFIATAFPAIAASLAAITVGDMFVSYVKFETRIWYLAMLMVLLSLQASFARQEKAAAAASATPATPPPVPVQPEPALARSRSRAALGGSRRRSGSR
jgi:hypothetical protein